MWFILPKSHKNKQININNKQMQKACELLMDFSWGEKEICQIICSQLFTVIMATGRQWNKWLGLMISELFSISFPWSQGKKAFCWICKGICFAQATVSALACDSKSKSYSCCILPLQKYCFNVQDKSPSTMQQGRQTAILGSHIEQNAANLFLFICSQSCSVHMKSFVAKLHKSSSVLSLSYASTDYITQIYDSASRGFPSFAYSFQSLHLKLFLYQKLVPHQPLQNK